ncbi:hypothetical protein J2Z29_002183 [Treponema pedis]
MEGDYYSVLLKVRDLVYEGHELLVHPLFASIRMLLSPIRTLILSDTKKSIKETEFSSIIIGDAIIKYKNLIKNRKNDLQHIDDYRILDLQLFNYAQKELVKMRLK